MVGKNKDLQNDRKVMKNADINIASIFFPLQLDSSIAQLIELEYNGLSTTQERFGRR